MSILLFHSSKNKSNKSIVLKPGPARWVDPGMELVWVEAKTRLGIDPARPGRPGGSTWDPANPARPGQNPASNPLTFIFFVFFIFLLKRRRFDFFKKKNFDPADPATRLRPGDPVKTRNLGFGPGRPPGRVLKL